MRTNPKGVGYHITKFQKLKIALLIISLAVGIAGLILIAKKSSASDIGINFLSSKPIEDGVLKTFVDLQGAIQKPGVYEIEANTRLSDLVERAGGFSSNADVDFISKNLNLTQTLVDGQEIYIPQKNEGGVNPRMDASQALVNINTASEQILDSLPGIGPITAQKIIASRPFSSINQLLEVDGIGESKFEQVKDLITL